MTPTHPIPLTPKVRIQLVRGDIDGFFGLFLDNLLQLMLITSLCPLVCGLPSELVYTRILPGAAIGSGVTRHAPPCSPHSPVLRSRSSRWALCSRSSPPPRLPFCPCC